MLTHFVQEMAPHETTKTFSSSSAHRPTFETRLCSEKGSEAPKYDRRAFFTSQFFRRNFATFTRTHEKQSNFSTIQVSRIIIIRLNFDVRKKIFGNTLRKISEFHVSLNESTIFTFLTRETLNLVNFNSKCNLYKILI